MNEQRLLTRKEVLTISPQDFPLLVLSYGIGQFIPTLIVKIKGGKYNHLMWYYHPQVLATQGLFFDTLNIREYIDTHAMKFITNINWTMDDRLDIFDVISKDLARPWWKRFYDIPGAASQAGGRLTKWMQIPGLDICSDKGRYLGIYDKDYNMYLPDPDEVNQYCKNNRAKGYRVYARYRPD